MVQGTATLPQEQELQEFNEKLEEFKNSLSDGHKKQLASMVAIATAEEEAAAQEGTDGGKPSEDEINEFLTKLGEFHNSLPGNQHQLLDALVGAAAMDNKDVQGYGWMWWGYMSYGNRRAWINECYSDGGTLYYLKNRWGNYIRDYRGRYKVGCWDDYS